MTRMALPSLAGLVRRLAGLSDPPEKIAGGAAIGMFLGILPGTGPIAALAVATVLKQNPASALLIGAAANFLAVPVVIAAFATAAFEVRHGGVGAIWPAIRATGAWTMVAFLAGGALASAVTYGITLVVVKAYRAKRPPAAPVHPGGQGAGDSAEP